MPQALAARLAQVPLCADFAPAAREALARLGSVETLAPGATLIRQGRPADAGFALLEGELDICRRLPGGGELALGTLVAPALVGELGLVAEVPRTADVRARGAASVLRWDRRLLAAACLVHDETALAFARRVVRRIAELDAALLARLAEAASAPPARPAPQIAGARDRPFDHAAFLALLKPCQGMDAALRVALVAATEVRELAAGERVYAAGSPVDGVALVLRGALELRPADERCAALQILGPGAFAGLPAALLGGSHAVSCYAREHGVLRWLAKERFDALYLAPERLGLALREAVAGFVADTALVLSNRLAQQQGLRRAQALLARQA
ncbi:MAG TPA: cyclic nucleotide-binding domain-containing protein [Gammaproteobacteria bacterium]|nr:cyclic nucleotide-binding domain-containing protein [Gammaproteobacteria bacterium]